MARKRGALPFLLRPMTMIPRYLPHSEDIASSFQNSLRVYPSALEKTALLLFAREQNRAVFVSLSAAAMLSTAL